MVLSDDLISQFVQVTNDARNQPKQEKTVYGVIVVEGGSTYVQLDGSDEKTPISTTTGVNPGDRVTVMIKNHTAIVTGNISSPSAQQSDINSQDVVISKMQSQINQMVDQDTFAQIKQKVENIDSSTKETKQSLSDLELDYSSFKQSTNASVENINAKLNSGPIILWQSESGLTMSSSHSISLSKSIEEQKNGLVLVFCIVDSSGNNVSGWLTSVIPRTLNGGDFTCNLGASDFSVIGSKKIRINGKIITGYDVNEQTGTGSGITYSNNKFVLRYVLGI